MELTIAIATIALSWAAVHTTFALHYAHDYYRHPPGGLQFPSGDKEDHADYWDFVYFSFVIGMTAQVSDVGITDKTIRRTATAHGIVSFIYNTALLALTVNIAASAISNSTSSRQVREDRRRRWRGPVSCSTSALASLPGPPPPRYSR